MKYIYRFMAITGLVLTLVPPILYGYNTMTQENMKLFMFLGTLIWFSGAIPWLGKKKAES